MVIMATDMALKTKFIHLALVCLLISSSVNAGDWTFTPAITFDEVYSNNIDSSKSNKRDSFVTRASATFQGAYTSKNLNFAINNAYHFYHYSINSDLNDNTRDLNANASLVITDGLTLNSSASVQNINRNDADNGDVELISKKTIQSRNYTLGTTYQIENSTLNLNTSINYNMLETDDNIGESKGYTTSFSTQNGNNARYVFWDSTGGYSDRENDGYTGQNYNFELKTGFITPYKLTPFIRYYNENSSGNISSNADTETSSWGPGLRWQIAPHVLLDASYNYVSDGSDTSDYLDTVLNWQPSSRTTLIAQYTKRFFGDSYKLDFTNRSKKLTNNITYNETLTAFDRSTYEANDDGELELIEDNEFSVSKILNWNSTLTLSRNTYKFNISQNKRKSINSTSEDNTLISSFEASRRITRKSTLSADFEFQNRKFNQDSDDGNEQIDYYRTYTLAYTVTLLQSISSNFKIQYLDRSSSTEDKNYDETRVLINISKQF